MKSIEFKFSDRPLYDYDDLTDEDIISLLTKDGKMIATRLSENYMKTRPRLSKYLLERYDDTMFKEGYNPYVEIVYRILHHIDKRPVCPTCGKPVNFKNGTDGFRDFCCHLCVNRYEGTKDKIKQTCLEKFGYTNALKSPEIRKKMEETNLERYGARNVYQSEEIKEKIKKTHIERLGVEYPMQSKEVMDKARKTCIEKYGVDRPSKCSEIVEKGKQTNLKKYGYTSALASPEKRKQIENTNMEKYGVKYATMLPEYQAKQRATNLERFGTEYYVQSKEGRKRNRAYWDSEEAKQAVVERMKKVSSNRYKNTAGERIIYQALCLIYDKDNIVQQYRSKEYPFICDFYIKSKNLYIEYQGSQYHQDHLYTGSERDLEIINEYKERCPEFGDAVELNWTVKDLIKRDKCIENNVKMIFVYPGITDDWEKIIYRERKHITYPEQIKKISEVLLKSINECDGFVAIGERFK